MITNKKTMIGSAAIIAVVALATGPFVVSNSNLIQPAYAKQEPVMAIYCFSYTAAFGEVGVWCENSLDAELAKQQCEMNRDAFAQDPNVVTISKCREIKQK